MSIDSILKCHYFSGKADVLKKMLQNALAYEFGRDAANLKVR